MENEVTVTEKGQTTIPISLRKKYKIEKGTRLQIIETEEGILFKPKKTIWDMIGAFSDTKTADEIDKQLDKLRHEDE